MEIVEQTTKNLADAYYQAVANKDLPTIANLLHTNVYLVGPLGHAEGKESVLRAVTGFATLLRSLRVNVIFGSEDQAMVNYDVDFGDPFGNVRSAALISCKDNLIARIELFFDARPFKENTSGFTAIPKQE